MSRILPFALPALVSFALGFAATRWLGRRSEQVAPPPTAPVVSQPEPVPEKVDDSPAASQKRIDAIFKLGGQQPGHLRDHALYAALRKLAAADFLAAATDFPALLARVAKGGWDARNHQIFVEAWMDRWLTVDAPGALRFLGSSPLLGQLQAGDDWGARGHQWGTVQGAAVRALARREPRWTHDWLAAQPAGPKWDSATHALLDQVARQNPAQARKFLASFSDGVNRLAAVEGFVTGLAATDARAGFEAASAEPAGSFRDRLLGVAMGEAGQRGVATVRALLDRIDRPELRLELAQSSLETMYRHSTDDPLPLIIEESERIGKSPVEGYYAQSWNKTVGWAVQGPRTAAAAEWAATLGSDPQRAMLGQIAGAWAKNEPAALQTWMAAHTAVFNDAAVESLGPTLAQMTKADRASMQTWADALPSGRLREQAQFQVALRSDDAAQMAAVYESVAARDADGSLAKQLGGVLAAKDGTVAADWAMRRPDGPARREAIEEVAAEWGGRDPRAAAEWLGQMPPGADRDAAVREYAWKVVYADPAAAAEWVEQVADIKEREYAATHVFHPWSRENPVAARAWLRGLPGIDDKFRAGLLRNFQ